MRFEESWSYLNKVGFRKCPYNISRVIDVNAVQHSDWDITPWKTAKSKKHQAAIDAKHIIGQLFDDKYRVSMFGKWKRERDPRITIEGPKQCSRCPRTVDLERDHIKPLSKGGSDVTDNLQWLCYICHKFKTTEDLLKADVARYDNNATRDTWHHKMWSYRLETLRRLNPPGHEDYISYWNDPRTHYEKWYQSPKKKVKAEQYILITNYT